MNKIMRKIDRFGQPVRLTHEGEHEFKTPFGGCLTIILLVALMGYGIQGFTRWFKGDIKYLTEEIRFNDVDVKPYFNPGKLKNSEDAGFNMALGFLEKRMPENIGTWELNYVVRSENETGQQYDKTALNFTYCDAPIEDPLEGEIGLVHIDRWAKSVGLEQEEYLRKKNK